MTGISDVGKLLKDIPNKVRDILGIMIDVNLITEKGKDILEIIVESYPYPVSYKGQYHKDYSSANPIQISVYNDKIIFWNEGQLPENWTISQLKEKHPSKPFNPVIANVFFRAGLIEAWGRGIFKIINACRISNSAEPVFKCDLSGFFVELIAQKIGTLGEKLGENRLEIIKLMQANQQISIAELSRQIGISTTAIERNIKYLKEKEIIKRVGAAKGGHWEAIIKK